MDGREVENEYTESTKEANDRRKLKVENERLRQELYDVRRKLELSEVIRKEFQEANESLEQSLGRGVLDGERVTRELEDKHRVARDEYEAQILDLESNLEQALRQKEELRHADNPRTDESVIKSTTVELINAKAKVASLENRVIELLSLLPEQEKKWQRAEARADELESQCLEFQRVSKVASERMAEKNDALEKAREELACMRAQVLHPKIEPASDTCKGNSLFAEVEDRRRNTVDKIGALRDKYMEAKRVCKAQTGEIKTLRAERAAMLRNWENEAVDTLAESEELTQRFKSRVLELEEKLEIELRRQADTTKTDSSDFSYFEALIASQKKEMNELRIKVECFSTRVLVQEEVKLNIEKQLRYWQCKAARLEAQVLAVKSELESKSTDDAGQKALSENFAITGSDPLDLPNTGTQLNCDEANLLCTSPKIEGWGMEVKAEPSHSVRRTSESRPRQEKQIRFCESRTDEESGGKGALADERKYPVLYIPEEPTA